MMVMISESSLIKYLLKIVKTGWAVIGAGWTAGVDSTVLLIKITFFYTVTIWQPGE